MRDPRPRISAVRLVGLLAFGAAIALAPAASAAALSPTAQRPLTLDGPITDRVGVIDDTSRAEAAIDDLASETGIGLFVVFVDDFERPSNPADWADETAERNDLGGDDILLAVAVDDGAYWASYAQALPIDDASLQRVENSIDSVLDDGDFEGAVLTAARGYGEAAQGFDGGVEPFPIDEYPTDNGGMDSSGFIWVVIVIGIVAFGAWALFRGRSEYGGDGEPSAPPPSIAELRSQSDRMLVQLDDAVQSATQELGFAEAQFGGPAVQSMTAAVATAKQELQQAFGIKQQLDDAFPEGETEQRQLIAGILSRCAAAGDRLTAADRELDALRELSGNAEQAVTTASARLADRRAALDGAAATVEQLRARYGADAVATIADNVDQARTLLADAERGVATASAQAAAGDNGQAALAVQAVQQAVAQASGLIDGVDAVRGALADSAARLDAARASVSATIAEAEALAKGGTVPATDLEPSIARARASIESSTAPGADPVAALARLAEAQQQLDPLLAGARDDATARAAAVGALEQAIQSASSQLVAARQYIETRRGGVGADARSRLQSAEALLAKAQQLRASDPVEALANARAAYDQAKSATELADRDVQRYRDTPARSDGGINGILGGFILGDAYGRRSTSGWGLGTGWGAGWGAGSVWGPPPRRSSGGGSGGGFWGGSSGSSGGSSRGSSGGWGFSGGGSRRSSSGGGSRRSSFGGGRSGGFSGGGSRRSSGGGGGRRR